MEQKLVQKQTQKMLFSQKMQQSVYILQMSIMELKHIVETEMETNPLLEEAPYETPPPNRNLRIEENDVRRDLRLTKKLTLQENLLKQLHIIATCQEDIDIGEEIIGNIDDNGYLKADFEEIAASLGVDLLKIEAMAAIVQSLEPLGVGARDLKECLLIQLEAKGKKNSLTWKIVENHLNECGKKQYMPIQKALGASLDEVKNSISEIGKLEPKPGRKYINRPLEPYIIPDIYVKKIDDDYQVISNSFDIPHLRINSFYNNMLKNNEYDKEAKDYVKQKMQSANFLIKCIQQRCETMQRITEFLIKE
ncbi:RNA polymerase sigma-54 factor, partial [Candidatus Omnitrophota bacterium]